MISWGSILYGAGLSALAALVLVFAMRERQLPVLTTVALVALVAPIGWNAVLRATHAGEFFTDAPISVFPASWQDTGSGVVTLAVASIALGLGPMRNGLARKAVVLALFAAVGAFLVDVYLY